MSLKEKLTYYIRSDALKPLKYICTAIYILWMLCFAVDLKYDFFSIHIPWFYITMTYGIGIAIIAYAVFIWLFFKDKNCEERKRLRRNVITAIVISFVLNLGIVIIRIPYDKSVFILFVNYLFPAVITIYLLPMYIMLWNEICSIAKKKTYGLKTISSIFYSIGLILIIAEYVFFLYAIFTPTSSAFVVTKTGILIYNLIPIVFFIPATPIKLFMK